MLTTICILQTPFHLHFSYSMFALSGVFFLARERGGGGDDITLSVPEK